MKLRLAVIMAAVIICFAATAAIAAETIITADQVKAIAIESAKAKGLNIEEADVIYDEGGQLWLERFGAATFEDANPNHGILKQGFLKNYRIVLFDFKEPIKDAWVFVDKDTGEVLTVYQE